MSGKISSNPSDQDCVVTLYHTDSRVSAKEWCNVSKILFSRQTAKKANILVASYFKIVEEWDKKLLNCIFLDDIELNWFAFNRILNPHITLGVFIKGNRNVVFNDKPGKFYTPVERPGKLAVTVTSVFGNNEYELDYRDIVTKRANDFSIVALFNSESFQSMMACSTNMGFVRKLDKINESSSRRNLGTISNI